MAFKTHSGIPLRQATTIINYLDQRFSGILDYEFDLGSPGIDSILKQFLHS
jgi:hypothetical protein